MGKPIYLIVKSAVLERIRSGNLGFGEKLPCEEDLAREFGCSRLTVHRALRELSDEGYVERRRRAGTKVATQNGRGVRLSIVRVDEEVYARNAVYRYELLDRQVGVPPAPIVRSFALGNGEDALFISCRHWADDRVFQAETRWINLCAAPEARNQPFEYYGPNRWLLENVPLSEVAHQIGAVAADKVQAKALGVASGYPLLQVQRQTWAHGRCVTEVTLDHPGDLYRLESDPPQS